MRPRLLRKGECLEVKLFRLLPIISFHSNRFNCRFFKQTGYYTFLAIHCPSTCNHNPTSLSMKK
ncbi:hypothetical protein GHT06_008352 [Daphnia sinensis]|uniref:Uncharacterized protein n=1 Tax=Daphnia sinensis TaxID=1820382 RepID=A0AAD5LKW0_9CRUS|nr:hypothetical protein GHT06_008352 [Daphnia sinensis]